MAKSALKNHPYADLFPMMTEAELDALAADIKEVGLRNPIVRYDGKILDGRNRLLACERAEVEPAFVDHEGDDASALSLVISLNVQRRDMTAGQRALVAAKALPMFEAAHPMGRPSKKSGRSVQTNGKGSRDDAAATFKVGVHAVQQAKAILSEAADLADRIQLGTVTLAAAYEELQKRREEAQLKRKNLELIAKYHEAVKNGEMTFDEAMEKALADKDEEKQRQDSQADARKVWLQKCVETVDWLERFVGKFDDDYLKWYTSEGPGFFEHGLDAKRLKKAIEQMERIYVHSFGGKK